MPLFGFERGFHAQAFEPLGHQAPINYVLNFKTAVFRNIPSALIGVLGDVLFLINVI